MNIDEASKYSICNMAALKNATLAGCYRCISIFPTSEIQETTDDGRTAMCPKCGVDSVLADSPSFPINMENLTKLNKRWF
jgi:hypothetical protein